MKKKIFLSLLVVLSLFLITGCGNNKTDKENTTNNGNASSPIVGEYKLQEVIDSTGTTTAEQWKKTTGSDESITINNKAVTKISSYGKNGDMTHDYTYDDKYFYDNGKIAFSYEYADGTLTLTDLRYENIERTEVYKRK